MDLVLLDQTLAQVLNDPNGTTYTPALRARCEALAIRAYSRFIAYKRRYGTGSLYTQGNIGDVSILTIGGPFASGAVVTLDPLMPWAETFTVTSVSRASSENAPFVGTPVQLNLSGALVNFHPIPTFVTQSSLGLTTVPGQDTYILAYDFDQPEVETFDIATGNRRWIKRQETFYDAVFEQSQAIFGVDYGMSQNFTGAPGAGFGFLGAPLASGPSAPGIGTFGQSANDILYTFVPGSPPVLQIAPVPNAAVNLDFFYYCDQAPGTIPDSDLDAICDMAQSECYRMWGGYLGGLLSFTEDYVAERPDQNARELFKMADAKQKAFDTKVRQRPYATSG